MRFHFVFSSAKSVPLQIPSSNIQRRHTERGAQWAQMKWNENVKPFRFHSYNCPPLLMYTLSKPKPTYKLYIMYGASVLIEWMNLNHMQKWISTESRLKHIAVSSVTSFKWFRFFYFLHCLSWGKTMAFNAATSIQFNRIRGMNPHSLFFYLEPRTSSEQCECFHSFQTVRILFNRNQTLFLN